MEAIKLNNKQSSTKGGVEGSTALYMTQEDTNILNKYRLNYACLCQNHSQEKAKSDFVKIGGKMFPEDMDNVKDFEKNYRVNLPEA